MWNSYWVFYKNRPSLSSICGTEFLYVTLLFTVGKVGKVLLRQKAWNWIVTWERVLFVLLFNQSVTGNDRISEHEVSSMPICSARRPRACCRRVRWTVRSRVVFWRYAGPISTEHQSSLLQFPWPFPVSLGYYRNSTLSRSLHKTVGVTDWYCREIFTWSPECEISLLCCMI